MKQDPTAAYKTATNLSVLSGRNGDFDIPPEYLGVPYTLTHQWQGYAIASASGNKLLIADYMFCAFRFGTVTSSAAGKHFRFVITTEAAGADYRMFPDVLQIAGANRFQTANVGPNGEILITRNADGRIYILTPEGNGYRFNKVVEPPTPGRWFLSAQLELWRDSLLTIEAIQDCTDWFKSEYHIDSFDPLVLTKVSDEQCAPFLYGVGRRPTDRSLWYITVGRCKTLQQGVYRGNDLVLPGYTGGGLCFLDDGSLLIQYYGYEERKPGALIHVPYDYLP